MLDINTFKEAMSAFATGVTIVTMKGTDEKYHGLTVSSFTSVSLDPPLVLFCRKNGGSRHKALVTDDRVVINILCQEQQDLVYQFANPKLDNKARFEGVDLEIIEGVPVLLGAKCAVVGRITDHHLAGDHTIFVCEALHVRINEDLEPLIYYNRGFHDLLAPSSV